MKDKIGTGLKRASASKASAKNAEDKANSRLLPVWQRAFSVFFAFCMVFLQTPVTALADTVSGDDQTAQEQQIANDDNSGDEGVSLASLEPDQVAVASIGTEEYASLIEAFAAVQSGETITVLADTTTSGIKVPSGSNLTLDLNGKTVSFQGEGTGSTGTETLGMQLLKDSNITIKNGKLDVVASNKTSTETHPIKMLIQNYSNLTLENVYIDGTNLCDPTSSITRYVVSNNCGNVSITGNTTIVADTGDIAVDTCKYGSYTAPTVTIDTTGSIGTIEASGGKLAIEAGTFSGISAVSGYSAGDIQISGGTFATAVPAEYCADGFVPTKNSDGVYGVGTPVAQVGENEYATFAEAVEAAAGTEVITLLADCNDAYTMQVGSTLKVAKNGKAFADPVVEGDYVVESTTDSDVTTYTTAVAPVAQVGDTQYASLPEAVAAASNG